MKKVISVVLLLTMALSLFAGCKKEEPQTTSNLPRAVEYLSAMYQTAGKDQAIPLTADMDVFSSVVVDSTPYKVDWKVEVIEGSADAVKVGESKLDKHVKLDIPLHSGEDILFNATATVSDEQGNSQSVTFAYMVEGVVLAGAGMSMEELLEAAYELESGASMEGLAVLTGLVTRIDTPYDAGYKNVTVTMIVEGRTDKPMKCYRMKGEAAETVQVGDTITVSGTLKNYNGTIEFDAGCMLDELIKGEGSAEDMQKEPAEIIAEAYALAENESLLYSATLTGKITAVNTPYDDGYKNVTVTIVVEGFDDKPIKCYRMKGEGADRITEGDVITVTGVLTNYKGTIEFGQGCTLDKIEGEHGQAPQAPADPLQVVDAAYALDPESALPYDATLTGLVTAVNTPYDNVVQNITVTMTVPGREAKPIQCFRLKGTGIEQLAVGDTVTVTGNIKNYSGTVQFDAGCTLDAMTKGPNKPVTKPATEVEIVDQAYKLYRDEVLPYIAELTGKVVEVSEPYNTQFQNVTVIITVPGRETNPIKCYRMRGTDVDKVVVGDTITVSGAIKNYEGSIQFDMGCNMTARVPGNPIPEKVETDPLKLVDLAYGLAPNQELGYNVSLTGKVSQIVEKYSTTSKTVTVVIKVVGREEKPIQCYRISGNNLGEIALNDTITVVGKPKNSGGTIQLTGGLLTGRVAGGGTGDAKPETIPTVIVDIAYGLKKGEQMGYDVKLTGKVTQIKTQYNAANKNISVFFTISDRPDKPILCFGLKGTGADKIAVGDTITVSGRLQNHNGAVEFASGCALIARTAGPDSSVKPITDPGKLIDAAYALEKGASLTYVSELTGKVTSIDTPYSDAYSNISVVIVCSVRPEKPILCYRMSGSGVDAITVGDTITVSGTLMNFNGIIEFAQGCAMTKRVPTVEPVPEAPEDPKKIVDAAFALEENAALPYTATLTGVVKSIEVPYDAEKKDVTLIFTVEGTNGSKDMKCYRLQGALAETVKAGETITVTGIIKNYNGTIEFTSATIEG